MAKVVIPFTSFDSPFLIKREWIGGRDAVEFPLLPTKSIVRAMGLVSPGAQFIWGKPSLKGLFSIAKAMHLSGSACTGVKDSIKLFQLIKRVLILLFAGEGKFKFVPLLGLGLAC